MIDDSDETEGRKLYRDRANAYANAQIAMGKRRYRIRKEKVDDVVPEGDDARDKPDHNDAGINQAGPAGNERQARD